MIETLQQISDASEQVNAGSTNLAQAAQAFAEGSTDTSQQRYRNYRQQSQISPQVLKNLLLKLKIPIRKQTNMLQKLTKAV